jgi:dihydroorotase-like cyclic amidohydrolase
MSPLQRPGYTISCLRTRIKPSACLNTEKGTWPIANPPIKTTGTVRNLIYSLSNPVTFLASPNATFSTETKICSND